MLKQLPLVSFLLFISACKPVAEHNSLSNSPVLVPQCIESQSHCETSTELANFSIKFSQQALSNNVKTELPFTIELTHLRQKNNQHISELQSKQKTKQSITKVSAHLEGKDMFMGKVPVFFEQGASETIYRAQSLLASCSEELMIWRLWITVEMNEQTQTFFVDFTSQRL